MPDAFLGSGSTLFAAASTGRLCRGVTLDVIARRYESVTGEVFGRTSAHEGRRIHLGTDYSRSLVWRSFADTSSKNDLFHNWSDTLGLVDPKYLDLGRFGGREYTQCQLYQHHCRGGHPAFMSGHFIRGQHKPSPSKQNRFSQ